MSSCPSHRSKVSTRYFSFFRCLCKALSHHHRGLRRGPVLQLWTRRSTLRKLNPWPCSLHSRPFDRPRRQVPWSAYQWGDIPTYPPLLARPPCKGSRRQARSPQIRFNLCDQSPRSQRSSNTENSAHLLPPQAFGQCDIFLSKYLKHAERHEVSSTSKAAQLVAADPSGTSAAIASRLAAEVHNLNFLASGIEDKDDNATRFFVLQRSLSHISSSSTEPIPPSPYRIQITTVSSP